MVTRDRRDSRLVDVPSIGAAGVAALRASTVAVLGAGNIGGHLAPHLVMWGVRLILIDRDVVEEVNLGTQAFREQDVGVPKVTARASLLGPLNPLCRIEPVHADLRELGLGALAGVNAIFSCLDSRAIRVVVNEIAVRLGVPWIDGALDGSGRSLFGRVAVYDPRDEQCGCYLCPHTGQTLAEMLREGRVAGCSDMRADNGEATAPTVAVSALGAAVASLQAAWGLGVLLHREPAVGREAYFDLGEGRMTTHRLVRNRRCVFDHQTYSLQPLDLPADRATVGCTFDLAERRLGAPVTLELQRRLLVATLPCSACGATSPARITSATGEHDRACACGASVQTVPTDLLDRFGRPEAAAFLHRTWSDLGVPPADIVVASTGTAEIHFLLARN